MNSVFSASSSLDSLPRGSTQFSGLSTQAVPSLGSFNSISSAMRTGMSGGLQGQRPGSGQSGPRGALLDVLSRGDPVLGYEWTGIIIDPGNPEPIPSVYIESIQAPSLQFDLDNRYYHGRNLSYPSKVVTDNLVIQLHNDNSGRAAKLASSWHEETFVTATGGFKRPKDYKKLVALLVHDPKHEQIYSILFGGCFPSSSSVGNNYDYASSEPMPVTLNLSVDYVFVTQ